jgi:hypothetical protein
MIDFSSLELSNDRVVAAILTHATFYVQNAFGLPYEDARADVDNGYKEWLIAVRTDRGVKPQ